ncbi:uncharacterized protein LACBIDRAFT_300264 [Laccaria bicolor S238N-H82]|uniref:Predicted protein n=1 Tax=Laccaria bicolor (strain S238N-H82 / ATCC MYA-4686) TaxID=486041 RepID=B0DGC5_LACBS|nr:uncharacterized protein LACBIDRAFT_300264 [Laccaria bicolor S238N-H82]EDR06249.1 predicted protein [Laccaria bicolor S238N-H82]|eukprot:XP_001883110.1 predicted protein [Laccaria bicolor S238N-H82]
MDDLWTTGSKPHQKFHLLRALFSHVHVFPFKLPHRQLDPRLVVTALSEFALCYTSGPHPWNLVNDLENFVGYRLRTGFLMHSLRKYQKHNKSIKDASASSAAFP